MERLHPHVESLGRVGSVLELDKVSGEPLDIYVNNRLIARGEAVVIGERYGVRLTEVLVNEHELEDAS